MSRDDYIKMAVDAGLKIGQHWDKNRMTTDNMVRFARIVAAAEREACKKICAEQADAAEERGGTSDDGATMAHSIWRLIHERSTASCDDAIRARGEAASVKESLTDELSTNG